MVRRKLIPSTAAIRSFLNSVERRSTSQAGASSSSPRFSIATPSPLPLAAAPTPSLKYIDERVNNVFNIILAEINHKNSDCHPSTPAHYSSKPIYRDPYNFKDSILQDLVANSDIATNYNIHDLIEEEFQLEISDQEFQQFKSLKDIVQYVRQRLEIRNSLLPYTDSGHFNSNINY